MHQTPLRMSLSNCHLQHQGVGGVALCCLPNNDCCTLLTGILRLACCCCIAPTLLLSPLGPLASVHAMPAMLAFALSHYNSGIRPAGELLSWAAVDPLSLHRQ